jgi:hypothetical protein
VRELRDRIRALETALNRIHINRTGHTHPLLSTAALEDDDQDHINIVKNSQDVKNPNPMQKAALVRGPDGSHRIVTAHGGAWINHVGHASG